ncbi:putative tpa: zn 2cys6 transcription factor [Diaporthe ampelina]|uniref:Putative tpa: zn 2cys6 transcription factor n=1 Tax=Diaporthe ampelina TaxID=1214573 RepID=A0A0G2FLH8_9PEZI|nr:putative tpa: zn 2cys6 transcription factor [Diaporthe ampelina]
MADETSCQDQLVSQSCQCRAGVAQLVAIVRAALQERLLDEVFQATSYFIRRCEGIACCGTRRVNCTDLSCVMAVV